MINNDDHGRFILEREHFGPSCVFATCSYLLKIKINIRLEQSILVCQHMLLC